MSVPIRQHRGIIGLLAGDTEGLRWENIDMSCNNTYSLTAKDWNSDQGFGVYHQTIGKASNLEFDKIKLKG